MRLIDANALINEAMERYCSDCERRKGVKNGKWKIVYSIGDAPCRACGTGDMIDELENAPTIEERKKGKWIPCSERLPEVGQSVLISVGGIYVAEGCLRWDGDWVQFRWDTIQRKDMVGAWKPFDEPWRGEEP